MRVLLVVFVVLLLAGASGSLAIDAAAALPCMTDWVQSYPQPASRCGYSSTALGALNLDCTCVNTTGFAPPLVDIVAQTQAFRYGSFLFYRFAVGPQLSVNVTLAMLNSSGWANATWTEVSNMSFTSGVTTLQDDPGLLVLNVQAANDTLEITDSQPPSWEIQAYWLPCAANYPPTVTLPQNVGPGANQLTATWQSLNLRTPADSHREFEVLLDEDSSGNFVSVANVTGDVNWAYFTATRKCSPQQLKIQAWSILDNNGTRGPACPHSYPVKEVLVRQSPQLPGGFGVDTSSLKKHLLSAYWQPTLDDGGCPASYTFSVTSGGTTLSSITVNASVTSVTLQLPALEADYSYRAVLTVSSEAGSAQTSQWFQTAPAPPDQGPIIGVGVGSAVGAVVFLGVVGFFVMRCRRRAAYRNIA